MKENIVQKKSYHVGEAIGGQSGRDFFAKMSIAYKECRETIYWLRLLNDSGIIGQDKASPLIADANELTRIIGSIQKTMKEKIHL